jgi:ribosomal protein S14
MATYNDGNVRKATASTVKAMRRSAEARRCPSCGRKSALVRYDDGWAQGRVCRLCGWASLVTPEV